MPLRSHIAAATLAGLLAAGTAAAQPVTGPYVSLGGGANFLQDEKIRSSAAPISGARLGFDTGFAASGAAGYGFGNGFRVELEGNWRQNDVSSLGAYGNPVVGGKQLNYGALANAIFDMDVGADWIYPYFGAGAGYSWTKWDGINGHSVTALPDAGYSFGASGTKGQFAYQGLFGVSLPIAYVPGLSLTAEYRFFSVTGSSSFPGAVVTNFNSGATRIGATSDYNHTLMAGLRFELFPPAPPAPEAPTAAAPPAPPAPEAARTYLVFFDWDRADLTTRARQIVAEAATASTHVQTTRIEVNGYTDLSGTAVYNQRLSERRAESVEAELVRDGVAKNEITIHGYGESNPLVPTAKGVREPQNRRVEIILK